MTDNAPPGQVEWTTIRQAAAAAGVSTKTIRRALKAGKIVGQRGDEQNDPWMIRADSIEAHYGTPVGVTSLNTDTPDGRKALPTGKPAAQTAALAVTLETFAEMLNEARKDEAAARERAARAETENEHLRARLAELRGDKEPDEPAPKPEPKARRQWWPLRRNQ